VPQIAARFQREVVTCKRIRHPNVVGISDTGTLTDGAQYLVMELLEGCDLAKVLADGPLPVARALTLTRQILLGLEAAHARGIAHRDIKPENIVLVQERGQETVKLVDFGIASNDRAAFKLTVAGIGFGTPEYISPEMAMGLPADARADLYSVGVVLFQMVTGRLPFPAHEVNQLLRAHIQKAPPSPRAIAPEARIPVELEAVILRAMAKLPEERFQSSAAMRQALEAVPLSRSSRRRGPLWLVLVLLAGFSLLGAWWWGDCTTPSLAPAVSANAPRPAGAPSARAIAKQKRGQARANRAAHQAEP
jgi:serine/threonine-protein kinase